MSHYLKSLSKTNEFQIHHIDLFYDCRKHFEKCDIHRSAEDEEILADAWYFDLTHLQRGLALNVNRILV